MCTADPSAGAPDTRLIHDEMIGSANVGQVRETGGKTSSEEDSSSSKSSSGSSSPPPPSSSGRLHGNGPLTLFLLSSQLTCLQVVMAESAMIMKIQESEGDVGHFVPLHGWTWPDA